MNVADDYNAWASGSCLVSSFLGGYLLNQEFRSSGKGLMILRVAPLERAKNQKTTVPHCWVHGINGVTSGLPDLACEGINIGGQLILVR
jgi:hypothetical protein